MEFSAEEGEELAKTVGLELIASLKQAVGDLDKVKSITKVNGVSAACRTHTNTHAIHV